MTRARLACLLALGLAACPDDHPAAEWGEDLFNGYATEELSDSSFNRVQCATCHSISPTPPGGDQRDPGYDLYAIVNRSSYWGGQQYRLLDAVNTCLVYFMRGEPLTVDDDRGKALYEFLLARSPAGTPEGPRPMTVVENVAGLPAGDATRGAALYAGSCQRCHGAAGTGAGNILDGTYLLPGYPLEKYPVDFPGFPPGLVVIEKVRHGRFFSVTGVMPFFSQEALGDAELADILTFLDLPSE